MIYFNSKPLTLFRVFILYSPSLLPYFRLPTPDSQLLAIIEISTFTFFGKPLTATVSLAGKFPEKYLP